MSGAKLCARCEARLGEDGKCPDGSCPSNLPTRRDLPSCPRLPLRSGEFEVPAELLVLWTMRQAKR
jgi:hypothetical protein